MTVIKNENGTITCIPPWSIRDLKFEDFEWWIENKTLIVVPKE